MGERQLPTGTQSHARSLILLMPCTFSLAPRLLIPSQYDNRADDLTKEGMLKGIEEAAAFVLFLSIGVLERPYCQLEIRHAVALKKPIILLHGELSEVRAHRERAMIRLPGRPPPALVSNPMRSLWRV